jgi:hypothetical protein
MFRRSCQYGANSSKFSKIAFFAVVFFLLSYLTSYAVATMGGTIVSINPAERKMVIKLGTGVEKTILLTKDAKAYKMNQAVRLFNFRVNEYVVLKIASALNEVPIRAELVMDSYSAQQYTAYRTVTPVSKPIGGGYATTGVTSPTDVAPLRGVYPNASTIEPGQVPFPEAQNWNTNNINPNGNAPMKVVPSPWGSPAMGAVLSPPNGGNSGKGGSTNSSSGGGGGPVTYNTGPVTPQTTMGGVNYNTGPSANNPVVDPTASNVPTSSGLTPDQAAWVANPTSNAPTKRMITFQGKIKSVDASHITLNIEELNSNNVYVVTLKKNTKITDYMTGLTVIPNAIQADKVVNVSGIAVSQTMVEALSIQIQR